MSLLRNARGQMTIFVALIFQVLFVFFAMAINIGLLVHDKINLQNSVDLGAYYGAQKMAEVMNAMAHINYQIRQDYKLMAYRMHVIGSLGYDDHPFPGQFQGMTINESEQDRNNRMLAAPACIGWKAWLENRGANENLCRGEGRGFRIRGLPAYQNITGDPFNAFFQGVVDNTRRFIAETCGVDASALNWSYAARTFFAYKQSIVKRKAALLALARNISSPDALDMNGDRISLGLGTTIANNLTLANRQGGFTWDYTTGFRGLTDGENVRWLSEIFITPQLYWLYLEEIPTARGGCDKQIVNIRAQDEARAIGVYNDDLFNFINGEPQVASTHSSLGFEKDPWYMGWVMVEAAAAPRKPFAPFGEPVQITARAYAKPFGGRMGPWHQRTWDRGSPSSGFGEGPGQTDPLTTPRLRAPGFDPGLNFNNQTEYVPNYSKYPGDQFGLRSRLAATLAPGMSLNANDILTANNFGHFANIPGAEGDPLSKRQQSPIARNMEMVGIAPDLFDLTYYSIENDFNGNYGNRGIWPQLGVEVPWDLGAEPPNEIRNIKSQLQSSIQARGDRYFYLIADAAHTLTGWHQRSEREFTLDPSQFGKCESFRPDRGDIPPVPGDCFVGGRTGYSVKFVSYDYLTSEQHRLGGENAATGAIANPPPANILPGP